MSTIDINKISQEVKNKYSIANNAFSLAKIKNSELDKYKNEPKDEINIEIGDTKQTDFFPQVKLCRWTNEVNFSVRLKDDDGKNAEITTLQDKIKWSKGNLDIEFYEHTEGEGGYKLVWFLKEKPTTNKVEFTIQSKGLDFFYQPELTPEEIAQGAFRPENVVGSYAVYHSTKGGMNDVNGKDYKVGKAFHIYRPHLYDSNGLEAWGNLHIENGIYSVEIPQDFLDKAVYPVKSNDTFGYTSAGVKQSLITGVTTSIFDNATGATGTGVSMSAYIQVVNDGTINGQMYLYDTNLAKVTNGVTNENTTLGTTLHWETQNFTSAPTLTAQTYYLAFWSEGAGPPFGAYTYVNYDNGSGNTGWYNTVDIYKIWPTTLAKDFELTDGGLGVIFSIYATYTPSGGEETPKKRRRML